MSGRILLILLLVIALGSLAALSQEKERTPVILDHADNLTATEVNGVRQQQLHGHVRILKDSLEVVCDEAYYYPDSGVMIFRNNVQFRDPHRTMIADEVIYNEFTEEVKASNRVRVYQGDTLSATSHTAHYFDRLKDGYLYEDVRITEENRRVVLTGQQGFIDHEHKYGRVTGNPVLTEKDSLDRLLTVVHGDTVEYFGEQKSVRVTGHVKVDRDSLIATGHTLDYFMQDHMALLLGTPHAIRGTDDVVGDTIRLFFDKDKLSRVEVAGEAVATSPADSGTVEPRNRMEGKRMTLWIENNVISSVLVEGTATATYFVRDKGERRGVNVTSGDRLRVFFKDHKMSTIRVEGGTEGIYKPQRLVEKSS